MVVASFVIALREGIEAALVVAIMLTYLKKSNQWELKKYVAYGTVAALVSSISVAAVMAILWGILEGPILAFFEGTVVIIATVLLTTMILWMWRAGPGIATEIEESVQRKTMLQSGIGLLGERGDDNFRKFGKFVHCQTIGKLARTHSKEPLRFSSEDIG